MNFDLLILISSGPPSLHSIVTLVVPDLSFDHGICFLTSGFDKIVFSTSEPCFVFYAEYEVHFNVKSINLAGECRGLVDC